MRSSKVRVHALAAVVLCAAALAACSERPANPRRVALGECRLPKVAQAAQCGHVDVPENRSSPNGRTLSIFVAVLPANTLSPAPDPLVIVAGGPGQAASSLGANTALRTQPLITGSGTAA